MSSRAIPPATEVNVELKARPDARRRPRGAVVRAAAASTGERSTLCVRRGTIRREADE